MPDVSRLFPSINAQPMSDRRIIQRFVNAWAASSRGSFPTWRQLRSIDLGSDWNWVYMVDLERSVGYPHFEFLGARLSELAEVYLAGGGEWAVSVLDKVADDINAAVREQGPNLREDSLVLEDGRALLVRCMTAPLSSEGEGMGAKITKVAGVVSGRLAELGEIAFGPVNDDSSLGGET
ncbi:MAG: hypothetical protein GC152_04605 [Alphaproteobacteria bacterium]|nr:hypothetical protein [Alphaproteobacteria bacterium]